MIDRDTELIKPDLLTMKIRIGIVGSRRYKNKDKVRKVVEAAIRKWGKEIMIISGGAFGADTFADEIAKEKNLEFICFNPAYEEPRKDSGMYDEFYNQSYNVAYLFERNTLIAEYSDYVIAFIPDGVKSNGTQDTVRKARKLDKKVTILN